MPNAFDDPDATFLVLMNEWEQHSLWPTSAEVPNGWTVVYGPRGREGCLQYVAENWTDQRPPALRSNVTQGVAA